MASASQYHVQLVSWAAAAAQLAVVRRRVFIEEQRVPEEEEWDGLDAQCIHAMALSADGVVIGTARLLPDGHIGRMAVLPAWRRLGVGGALLATLLAEARRRGHRRARVNAQEHALGFYQRFGFEAHGPVFLDAGIPHRAMVREFT